MLYIEQVKTLLYLIINGLIKESRIFTHLTNSEKVVLNKLSKASKNKEITAVEIGSYLGASSCFIAKGLCRNNGSKLYCIDTWGNHAMTYDVEDKSDNKLIEQDTYLTFKKNTAKHRDKIIELKGWSTDVIHELKNKIDKIDYLFIDGDHNYLGVKKDWIMYSPLLVDGSIVIFHDTGWAEGVKRVIHEDVLNVSTLIKKLPNLEAYKIKK